MNSIEVNNLTKKFGSFTAVDKVSFTVKQGEIFGFLGANGAGKSTTIRMLIGILEPTSGDALVGGYSIKRQADLVKTQIGYMSQKFSLYNDLTVEENIRFFAGVYGLTGKKYGERKKWVLKVADLEGKEKLLTGSLPGGIKQRLALGTAVIHEPKIVFLDEPTTGLDPLARRNLWNVIADIKKQGKTVILTTHYLEEAEVLCDRIAIMEKGQILQMGATDNLVEQAEFPFVIRFLIEEKSYGAFEKLSQLGKFDNALGKLNVYELKLKKKDDLEKALPLVQNMNPESLTVGRISLEDLFIELTGKNIESS